MRRRYRAGFALLVFCFAVSVVFAILASCTFSLAPLEKATPTDSAAATSDASLEAGCTDDVLTSPVSCGACGHDCGGGTCDAGACQAYVMSDAESMAYGLTQDDTYLYYTLSLEGDGGEIRRMRKDTLDGSSTTLAIGEDTPKFIVIDSRANLFWTSNRGVSTMPADGGAVTLLCPEQGKASYALAVDPASDGVVYTVTQLDASISRTQGGVYRCSWNGDGGVRVSVAPATYPKAVAIDPLTSTLYWTSYCDVTDTLDASRELCDAASSNSGSIDYVAASSGTPKLLNTVGPGAEGFAVLGGFIYVAAQTNSDLYKLPTPTAEVSGSTSTQKIFHGVQSGLNQVVVDPSSSQTLYLSEVDPSALFRFDLTTQDASPLPDPSQRINGLVVDDRFIYWTSQLDNAVVSLRK